ncbi:MAG: MerR family transcriptional regulator [Suilimivivens sp.]
MVYTISELANLAGISTRTLRFYDEKGLLKPTDTSEAGYRFYDEEAVLKLQQIMFFRELDFALSDIGQILSRPDFDRRKALEEHLQVLQKKRERIDALILTVIKTIEELQGGKKMSDKERFEAFKKDMVKENEECYGKEVRAKYGDKAVDASNAAVMGMSREQFDEWKQLENQIKELLGKAVQEGKSPESAEGKEIARLHRKWCSFTLKTINDEIHAGLAQMYTADERFMAYYDEKVTGCAAFLREAILKSVNA